MTTSFARRMERKAHDIAKLMQRETRPHMTVEPRIASIESFTLAPDPPPLPPGLEHPPLLPVALTQAFQCERVGLDAVARAA